MYEYRCTSCGYTFEKIQNFSAKPETECPQCQGVLIRPVTAPALRFEGAGWYVNDYAGRGGAKTGESTTAADKAAGGTAEASKSSDSSGGDTSSAKVVPSAPAAAASTSAPAAPAKG